MTETLLKSNRRAASLFLATAVVPLGLGLMLMACGYRRQTQIISWTGGALVVVGGLLMRRQLQRLLLPRLALSDDSLLVYLRGFVPWRVPLDAVECFFLGQSPSPWGGTKLQGRRVESVTVVVRLAERAKPWHQRRVDVSLGKWSNGYITIFGIWCEPLDGEVVRKMNHRLSDKKRQSRRIL